jgi:hypothetical protein
MTEEATITIDIGGKGVIFWVPVEELMEYGIREDVLKPALANLK